MHKSEVLKIDTLDILKELLREKNKTQKDLCEFLGLSKNTFSDWIAQRSVSYQKYLPKIAEYFNVSVDYLLGKEEKPAPSDELTENLIIYHRNGKTVRKQFTKEQMEQLMRDIDALESTIDEDL